MSEPEVCASCVLTHRAPQLAAWDSISNLVALVTSGTGSGGAAEARRQEAVVLVEPSCSYEHFTLALPSADTHESGGTVSSSGSSTVASIAWSPPGTRRALLVARSNGHTTVWMQEPQDESRMDVAAASLPAVNVWYASTLGNDEAAGRPGTASAVNPHAAAQPPPAPAVASAPVDEEMPDFFAHDAEPQPAPAAPAPAPEGTPGTGPAGATPTPAPAEDPLQAASGDPAAGEAPGDAENVLVHACWLAPGPVYCWYTERLCEPDLQVKQLAEVTFQADVEPDGSGGQGALPSASWSVVQHWVRPSLLAAAFVRSSGEVTFTWATMSARSTSRLAWHSSQPVQLPLPSRSTVVQAHACCGHGNAVRVALVTREDPSAVQLFEVSGSPALQHLPNLPPAHRMAASALTVLRLPGHAAGGLPTRVNSLSLLPSSFGTGIAVATCWESTDNYGREAGCWLYLYRETSPAEAAASPGLAAWTMTSHYKAEAGGGDSSNGCKGGGGGPLDEACRSDTGAGDDVGPVMAVSEDGSKVVLWAGGRLHVVGGAKMRPLAIAELPAPTATAAGPGLAGKGGSTADEASSPAGGGAAAAAAEVAAEGAGRTVLCLSPNSCCVAVAQGCTGRGVGPAASGGPHHSVSNTLLQVLTVPEIPCGSAAHLLAAKPDADSPLPARLDAFRMLHAALTGRHPWDISQRCMQLGRDTCWASCGETLRLVDAVFQAYEDFPKPSYSGALDRVKLALLRRLPGPHAAALTADLAARMVLKQRHLIVQVLSSVAGSAGSAAAAADGAAATAAAAAAAEKQARLEDLAAVQPWLVWAHSYFMLMLASIKRFQQPAATAALAGVAAGAAAGTAAVGGGVKTEEPGMKKEEPGLKKEEQGFKEEEPGLLKEELGFKKEEQGSRGSAAAEGGGAAACYDDALPGLRLLQDSATMQKLGQLLLGWSSWARLVKASDLGEQEQLIKAFIGIFNPKDQAQSKDHAEAHPDGVARSVFQGPYYLHIARPSRYCVSADKIRELLPSAMRHLVPDLTAEELADRARDLGIFCHCTDPEWGGRFAAATTAVGQGWQGWRQHRRVTSAAEPAERQQQQGGGAGAATGEARNRLRQRWRAQRARALRPLGSAAAAGSLAVAAAALDAVPMIDALSGKRLAWETAAVSYESVDGAFATVELAHGVGGGGGEGADAPLAAPAPSRAGGHAMLRKSWAGSSSPSGGMWKRVKRT